MKKCIALLLLFALFLSSCNNGSEDETKNTVPAAEPQTEEAGDDAEIEEEEIGRTNMPDTVPSGLNFNGATVTILSRADGYSKEFVAEELTGDGVNDAIFYRNAYTQERLNVNLNVELKDGGWGKHEAYFSAAQTSILAGDGAYDIFTAYAYCVPTMIVTGLLDNLYDIPYLDFSMPWWNANFREAADYHGNLYVIVGDISLSSTSDRVALFFNQKLKEDYLGGTDLYEMVLNGTWTVDQYSSLVSDLYTDLNGNGQRDENDFYGAQLNYGSMDSWFIALGGTLSTRDADDNIIWDINNEHNINITQKYNELTKLQGVYFLKNGIPDIKLLDNGRAIFSCRSLSHSSNLRDFEDPYGILPLPKWDETQKGYRSLPSDGYNLLAIPIDCKQRDVTGAVLEVMCAESYRSVTPAYFEVAMKTKYFRDDISSQMFDIILEGAQYDFAIINTSILDNPVWMLRDSMEYNQFASYYQRKATSLDKKLEDVLGEYENIKK